MNKIKKEKLSKHQVRVNNLMKLLDEYKVISIADASEILDVSTMTIRRDCEALVDEKKIGLKNGLLFLSDGNEIIPIKKAYELEKESTVQNRAKAEIGKYAASLIEDGETIIIDTGSTTETIPHYINQNKKFTVFCSNLNILNQIVDNENVKVRFSGGVYHSNTQMFESEHSINFINSFRANKAFISAAGVHNKLGLTCINAYEVQTKQAIINSSAKNILLVDSSKFGKVHSCYYSDLQNIDMVITDKGISHEWIETLKILGIEVVVV